MGNLVGSASSKAYSKFTVTGANIGKFDAQVANLSAAGQAARQKARPSTEVGRTRGRRATEPVATTDITDEDLLVDQVT